MTDDSEANDREDTKWMRLHDELLRGLNHALSNRIGTLAAVVELSADDVGGADHASKWLPGELNSLENLLGHYRMLPAPFRATAEPLRLQDVVPEVVALYSHHWAEGDTVCRLEVAGDVAPVLMNAWRLRRTLLLAIDDACTRARREGKGSVTLSMSDSGGRVVLSIASAGETSSLTFDSLAAARRANP